MNNFSNIKFKIVDGIKDEWLETLFEEENIIYVKPGTYAMSTRKLESLIYIARLQKYYQCNPVRFIDDFFNIELLDAQAYVVQRTWNCPNVLVLASRGFGKSTVIDLILMSKDMLFCNVWSYIASGSGSQAEETFTKLEQIANDNIDEMRGSTGYIFKNEVEINNAAGDGFSHGSNGFKYSLYNGSFTQTLNSNIDRKRGLKFPVYYWYFLLFNYFKGERIMIKIRNYTQEEIKYIKENYNNMTTQEIAIKLNKSIGSINNATRKMGLIKQPHSKWTDKEIEFLKKNYINMTSEEISKHVNHSIDAINTMRDKLGLVRNKNWSDEEIQFLKDNFESTLFSELSKVLGRTENAIRVKCFDLNLFKNSPWTDDEINFVKENYMEMKNSEISKILNRTMSAIELKARKLGLKKYPYMCDYHYFDEINTEEKAYWLGFLTADGWINKNYKSNAGVTGIELQYGDLNHLKKFNKSINGNYQITDRWRTCSLSNNKEKKNHMCCIRIFSLTMYNSLVNIGFSNNKSYDFHIPDLPQDLIRHYIRGYFDGDGCLCFTNKSFNINLTTASKILNDDVVNILKSENFNVVERSCISDFGTTLYSIDIYRQQDKINFLDWIYQDCNIYLDRKYKKYLKVKERYNNTQSLAV